MAALIHDHPIAWAPPSPFWPDADRALLRKPVILRFSSDDFMDEVQRVLARDPDKLRGRVAVPETWRGIRKPARTPNPHAGTGGVLARLGVAARRGKNLTPVPESSSDAHDLDLKLYQPAHQRFYLVAASLVCHQAGLPDRYIDRGHHESAVFVMRRWFPPNDSVAGDLPVFESTTWVEHAFVAQSDGSFAWVPVAEANASEATRAALLEGEEQLPLFPLTFAEDDGRTRRLLAGLIPVGKREAYHAAMRRKDDGTPNGTTRNTARVALFRKLVSEPWKAIVEQARAGWVVLNTPPSPSFDDPASPPQSERAATIAAVRSNIQLASWFVLADLVGYFQMYLPSVYRVLAQESTSAGLDAHSLQVLDVLEKTALNGTLFIELNSPSINTLKGALQQFINTDTLSKLENAMPPFVYPGGGNTGYPGFRFPLSDLLFPENAALLDPSGVSGTGSDDDETLLDPTSTPPTGRTMPATFDMAKAKVDGFAAAVIRALEFDDDQAEPAVPTAAERPADMRDGWFHLRCVYERPACGPLHRDVVSRPSDRFKLAGFFDPDAPARPIRIGLPIDTTPAGLRKFDKNTAFVMSDILCGQVGRMKGLTLGDLVLSVLPWPFHKDLPGVESGPCNGGMGLVCSLSIPIITICALILLIIMVTVLDIIFHWLPFLMVCFPIPGLRAKKLP
jgi:hypothetical protein